MENKSQENYPIMDQSYVQQLKQNKDAIKQSEKDFETRFQMLFTELNNKFESSSALVKLAKTMNDLDTKLVMGWYVKSLKNQCDKIVFMHNDSKLVDDFCITKQYILPGVRPSHLISEDDMTNNTESALYLKQCISNHIPLIYIYAQISLIGETDLAQQASLIKIRDNVIKSINNSKKMSDKKVNIGDILQQYMTASSRIKDNSDDKKKSKAPKLDIGLLVSLLKYSSFGNIIEKEARQKIQLAIQNGTIKNASAEIIKFYRSKGLNDTADIVQKMIDHIVSKLESMTESESMINKLISLVTELVAMIGPELENGKLNIKDIFIAIADKIEQDPSGRLKNVKEPLMAMCALIDYKQKKNIDPTETKNVLLDLFCKLNNCDRKQMEGSLQPIINIIEESKNDDDQIDPMKIFEIINELGGIDGIKNMLNNVAIQAYNSQDVTNDQINQNQTIKQSNDQITESTDNINKPENSVDTSPPTNLADKSPPLVNLVEKSPSLGNSADKSPPLTNTVNNSSSNNQKRRGKVTKSNDNILPNIDPDFINVLLNDPAMHKIMNNAGIKKIPDKKQIEQQMKMIQSMFNQHDNNQCNK
jgi:hypothetical protein